MKDNSKYLILFTLLIIISAILLAFLYFASINAARIGSSLSQSCYDIILRRP